MIERVPHAIAANRHNQAYLETKARRAGHLLKAVTSADRSDQCWTETSLRLRARWRWSTALGLGAALTGCADIHPAPDDSDLGMENSPNEGAVHERDEEAEIEQGTRSGEGDDPADDRGAVPRGRLRARMRCERGRAGRGGVVPRSHGVLLHRRRPAGRSRPSDPGGRQRARGDRHAQGGRTASCTGWPKAAACRRSARGCGPRSTGRAATG